MHNGRPSSAYAALVSAGVLWGLGFPFGKAALAHMPVEAMIVWRFAVACAVLSPFLFARESRRVFEPHNLAAIAIAGALFVPVQFVVQFEGLQRTSVSHASLMVALVPGVLAIASGILTGTWPGKRAGSAIALSMAGAAIVAAGSGAGATWLGDVLVLLSLIAAVAWVLFTQRYLSALPAAPATAAMLLAGTCMLAVYELLSHPGDLVHAYPAGAWWAVAAAGVLSTAASTLLWNRALQRVDASRAGVFINLEPIVGALCGVLFFHDAFGWQLAAGGVLVITGAAIVTMQRAPERAVTMQQAA